MSAVLAFTTSLVRTWTATYTRGLPSDLRAERIGEIDADLWEQHRFAQLGRQPTGGTAFEIFCRLALGMPADVLWRIETGAANRIKGENSVNSSTGMRIGLLVVTLPLLLLAALGIGIVMGEGDFQSRSDQVLWGLAFTACPVVAIIGLWLSAAKPRLGVAMVVAGFLAMSVLMFWMWFIVLPVGAAAVAFTIKRSGLNIWPNRRHTPTPA